MKKFQFNYYTIGGKNILLLTYLTEERASNLEVREAVGNELMFDPKHYIILVKGEYWWRYFWDEHYLSLIFSVKKTDTVHEVVEKIN